MEKYQIRSDNQEFYENNPDALKALGAYALYKEVTEPPHSLEKWGAWVLERAEQDE